MVFDTSIITELFFVWFKFFSGILNPRTPSVSVQMNFHILFLVSYDRYLWKRTMAKVLWSLSSKVKTASSGRYPLFIFIYSFVVFHFFLLAPSVYDKILDSRTLKQANLWILVVSRLLLNHCKWRSLNTLVLKVSCLAR